MAEHARSSHSLLIYLCLLLLSSSSHLAMSMDVNNTGDRSSSEVAPARRLYGNGSTDQQNTNTSSNRSSGSPLCRLLSLQVLDLANNQFTGELPACWREMQALQFMDVSNNSFSGDIPEDGKMGVDVLQHGGWERRSGRCVGLNAINRGGGIHGSAVSAWEEEAAEKAEAFRSSMEGARGEHKKGVVWRRRLQLAQRAQLARRAQRSERGWRCDRRGAAVAREQEDQPAQADTM